MSRRLAAAAVAFVLVFGIAATGCGSRLSHEVLLRDATGGSSSAGSTGGGGPSAGASGAGAGTSTAAGVTVSGSTGGPSLAGAGAGGSVTGASGTGLGPASGGGSGSGSGGAGGLSSSSGSATGGGAAACSGTGAPINLGSVGTQSGLVGSIIGGGALAVQAWVASINASGGLNCHPVKYTVIDDGGDPSRQQAGAQQLVEQDHVIAMVQMDAVLSGQASLNYLTQRRIPVIGDEGGSSWFYTSPMYFPQAASGDPTDESLIAAGSQVARMLNQPRIGTLNCLEAPICSTVGDFGQRFAGKFGVQDVYKGAGSLVQPDFTANCQSARSAGVQVLIIAMDGNSVQRILQSCNTVNFHPTYIAQSLGLTSALPSFSLAQGLYGANVVIPWMLANNPGVVAYQNVMKRYAPGVQLGGSTMEGWVSAQLFQVAAAHMPNPPSSQAVLDGLWSIKNNDLGGITSPLTFTKDQNAPENYCYWLIQIQGGKYISPDGGQRTCGNF
jgi:branched-chain amino acid transport system substrate-binding protein